MTDLQVHHANYSYQLEVLVPQAVEDNYSAVQSHYNLFIQAYDPGLTKSASWRDVDYEAVHQWVVDSSSTPGTFDANWALAASAVFFRYDDGSSTQNIPDPCPGCWGPTSLRASAINTAGSYSYVWHFDEQSQKWVKVCRSTQALSTTQPSPPIYPEVVISGQIVAVVRGFLEYGQEVMQGD